jgi:plasmid stability protein
MPDVLVRDLDVEVIDRLKNLAKSENRSLQAEMKSILSEASRRGGRRSEIEAIRAIRARVKTPQKTDSADLLREDRDR